MTRLSAFAALALAVLALASPVHGQGTAAAALEATLPASFEGTLPAGDGPGIRYHLDLFADGSYALRTTFLARGEHASFDDLGRWVPSSDGRVLVLRGGREAPELFHVDGSESLTKLDLDARPVAASASHAIRRTAAFAPIEPSLPMRGEYRYLADAATFRECLTGRALPVAMEEQSVAVERAYLAARPAPGEPVVALVQGRIVPRPPMEGTGTRPTLVVDRLIRLQPETACAPLFRAAPLLDTEWTLTAFASGPVPQTVGKARPAHVLLRESQGQRLLAGSGGCNRLTGGFTLDGDRIAFRRVATTKMVCPKGMDAERRLLDVLAQARSWRVLGRLLELYDEGGARLARFEARAPGDAGTR